MVQDHTEIVQAAAAVAQEATSRGLPQMNVIADGSFTNQLAWLLITFFTLFLIVWRAVLPRVTTVLEEREERIANDLDKAGMFQADADEIKAAYEAEVASARAKAQEIVLGAKSTIQADIAKIEADLETELSGKADAAEARINKVREAALADIGIVAREVAAEMVTKFGGIEAKDKAITDAVSDALSTVKGA